MDFKNEIIGLKDHGDKTHVDENVSNHGSSLKEAFKKTKDYKNIS